LTQLVDSHNAAFKAAYAGSAKHYDVDELTITRAAVTSGSLAECCALVNECRAYFKRHIADAVVHKIADATGYDVEDNSVDGDFPDATDQASADTLANQLKADFNDHVDATGVHANDDNTAVTATDGAGTLAALRTLASDIRAKMLTHRGLGVAGNPTVRLLPL